MIPVHALLSQYPLAPWISVEDHILESEQPPENIITNIRAQNKTCQISGTKMSDFKLFYVKMSDFKEKMSYFIKKC